MENKIVEVRKLLKDIYADLGYKQSDGYMDGVIHSQEYDRIAKFLKETEE